MILCHRGTGSPHSKVSLHMHRIEDSTTYLLLPHYGAGKRIDDHSAGVTPTDITAQALPATPDSMSVQVLFRHCSSQKQCSHYKFAASQPGTKWANWQEFDPWVIFGNVTSIWAFWNQKLRPRAGLQLNISRAPAEEVCTCFKATGLELRLKEMVPLMWLSLAI